MADAHGSGPCIRKDVGVQLPPRPPSLTSLTCSFGARTPRTSTSWSHRGHKLPLSPPSRLSDWVRLLGDLLTRCGRWGAGMVRYAVRLVAVCLVATTAACASPQEVPDRRAVNRYTYSPPPPVSYDAPDLTYEVDPAPAAPSPLTSSVVDYSVELADDRLCYPSLVVPPLTVDGFTTEPFTVPAWTVPKWTVPAYTSSYDGKYHPAKTYPAKTYPARTYPVAPIRGTRFRATRSKDLAHRSRRERLRTPPYSTPRRRTPRWTPSSRSSCRLLRGALVVTAVSFPTSRRRAS